MIKDISGYKPEEAFRGYREKEKTYAFDYAFDQDIEQEYIFERTTKFLIEGVMTGFNSTVFAYGATGAGKTYTMMGEEDRDGIMLLSVNELFNQMDRVSSELEYQLKISYIEVYNENIKDLLNAKSPYWELREDPTRGVTVAGVTEIMTTNTEEIMYLLREGNKLRTKEATHANEASSRSHAVMQVVVENKEKSHGLDSDINIGKLSLIDLAGSERASATLNTGKRLIEGANINRSLLALANCINALCSKVDKGGINHIPYRDSKLTRLLKDSLGGNCRTVMIANISPSFMWYEDTLNTLKYADRAKQIKTVVKRNTLNVEYHISNYRNIINNLRSEIVNLKGQLTEAKKGGSVKHFNDGDSFLPDIPQSAGTPNKQSNLKQAELKKKQLDMSVHFEREAIHKKKILEWDKENEKLAFQLFGKELQIRKLLKDESNDPVLIAHLKEEIEQIKSKIDETSGYKQSLQSQVEKLEKDRDEMLYNFRNELHGDNSVDALLNQHLLNIKDIEYERKEK